MSKKNNYKVYVHINKINGKRYYGITKQKVENRWNNGKGYKNNKHFWNAINKYDWNEGFEHIVIAKGLSEEEAKWLEIELIKEWNTTDCNKGYNITLGGDDNPMNSEESRKKISKAKKGHEVTEESRKKISKANKGHEVSEETRKKISEGMKRHEVTEETRKKISEAKKGKNNGMYGKTHSEETRKKMSEAKKDKYKGKNNPSAKAVYIIELDKYFDTVMECARFLGCHKSNVSSVLHGRNKTCKKYHIIYAEDKEKLAS